MAARGVAGAHARRRCDDLGTVDVQGGAGWLFAKEHGGETTSCPAAAVTSTITFALSSARDWRSLFQRIGALNCAK